MFTKKADAIIQHLDDAIDECFLEMKTLNSDSDEYKKQMESAQKLIETRDKLVTKRKVNPDTLALILANLAGIGIIIVYEQKHVLASKALGFVSKLKL